MLLKRTKTTTKEQNSTVASFIIIIKQLTISAKRQRITPLPTTTPGATDDLVVPVTLAHTTVFTASSSQPTELTVLVDWFTDPVDSWVTTNSLVEGVHHDHLKELVSGILCDPVGVDNSQATTVSASTLLRKTSKQTSVVPGFAQRANFLNNFLDFTILFGNPFFFFLTCIE